MPLNVRRLVFSSVCLAVLSVGANAQTAVANDANIRLNRAKALIAARNFSAATAELETLRRSSGDASTQQIASVMLTSIYLEQARYTNVNEILSASYERYKTSRDGSYFGIAGKIINSAKEQVERYRQLGFRVSDDKLPPEVAQDLDVWRTMLETLIRQSEELTMKSQKTTEPYLLMEAAVGARSLMARDVYDAARWKTAMEDVREMVAESQTKVEEIDDNAVFAGNAAGGVASAAPNSSVLTANTAAPKSVMPASAPPLTTENAFGNRKVIVVGRNTPSVAAEQNTAESKPNAVVNNADSIEPAKTAKSGETSIQSAAESSVKTEVNNRNTAQNSAAADAVNPTRRERSAQTENSPSAAPEKTNNETSASVEETPKNPNQLISVGSLDEYAARKILPVYPQVARSARITGVVRVELKVDEKGEVTEAQVVSGPEMLKRAAVDAARKWRFKPIMREGQPTRATGFISFNFTL